MEVDYKAMYIKMVDATEKALELLVDAQRECEQLYIEAEERSEDTNKNHT